MKKWHVLFAVLAVLAVAVVASVTRPIDAKAASEEWLVIERKEVIPSMNDRQRELFVACDTYTGTLLYIVGTPGTAITAVPGGCRRSQ